MISPASDAVLAFEASGDVFALKHLGQLRQECSGSKKVERAFGGEFDQACGSA
jgi:hypothetical protein